MNFPEDIKYSQDHEWIKMIDEQTAIVGITDFAQSELGDIVYVDITTLEEEVNQNDIFGSIEAVKTVSDLFMPLDAEVIEVNEDLEDSPELVNEEPYEKGWIIKVKVKNAAQLDDLMDAAAYKSTIGKD